MTRSAEQPPGTRRAGRRPDPRPARSLQRLHAAAIELGAEHGINATTVDDIAALAQVSKGTVYNNVASKEDLFTGAMVAGVDRLTEALTEAVAQRSGPEAVQAAVAVLLARVTVSADFARLFLAESWRPGRPWHGQLQQARGRAVDVLAAVLARSGTAVPDPALAATMVLGSAVVAGLDLVAEGMPVPQARLDAVTEQLLALFAGLR